jgi:hypothetical protein
VPHTWPQTDVKLNWPAWHLQGVAINFVRNDDIRILRDIEQYYSTQIDEMVRPILYHVLSEPPQSLTSCVLAANERGGADLGTAWWCPSATPPLPRYPPAPQELMRCRSTLRTHVRGACFPSPP